MQYPHCNGNINTGIANGDIVPIARADGTTLDEIERDENEVLVSTHDAILYQIEGENVGYVGIMDNIKGILCW